MDFFPLTRPQQRIYDLERFAAGAAGIAASVLFRGTLEEGAMQQALQRLLEQNDGLRLRMAPPTGGRVLQSVAPYQEERFPFKRFSSPEELHTWAARQARQPLDMAGPLYRFTMITVGDCFGLFLRFHHLIADAWSVARFASLAYAYYRGAAPQPAPSYAEYAAKEAAYLQGGRFTRDRDFWLGKFPAAPAPGFLAKQPSLSLAAARWDAVLTPVEAQPLRDFAAKRQVSLYTLLMLTLGVYLYRLRGQSDAAGNPGQTAFCIGTTTLGRANRALKDTFGMFVGTVPAPISLDPAAGFGSNAAALKETLLAALRHEGFGAPDLQEALRVRDGFEGRLYDVLLNYQNAALAGMDDTFAGTWWYSCGVQPETLQLQVSDRDNTGGLYLSYDYHTEQFTETEIQRLHQRLLTLLADGIARPDVPLDELTILCGEDRRDWDCFNRTERPLNLRPVHRFFEDEAAVRPDRLAVVAGETRLTYGDLNGWAARIAAWLKAQGLAAGGVVAVRLERCPEMMPLLLGIMKAGCAYLPLSPASPAARVHFILRDARAALLVCQPGWVLEDAPCPVFSTENLHDLPAADGEKSSGDPDLLAYVMYTSGSTGQPKGVRVGQAGLCNRLLWMDDTYPLAPDEILIQKTSYAFDVSAWELFWPLMRGRALLLPEPGAERQPRRLAELIRQHGIRTIHFVPSMLALFLDDFRVTGQPLPSLRRVIVSGEALTPALNQRFYQCFAGTATRLYNLYGPTECTVDVLYYDCGPEDTEIPIGRPVWNTAVYVLDAQGNMLPPGEAGELCVAGIQLAKGYADPALDENRFVDHLTLGRLYRTGDQCSLRPDGEILYHGRNDGQVKIRGQRVELAEIERQLEQAPGVARAAALFDGARLRAFLLAEDDFDQERVGRFLRERLPAYMIPDQLRTVEEFPLNPNGKLDRKRLAALTAETAPAADSPAPKPLAAPVTERERQILAAVLAHLPPESFVGMDDSPSRCGLSSLDIVSVTLELEAQGLRLSANDFYAAANFRALAARAEDAPRPLLHQIAGDAPDSAAAKNLPTGLACVGVPYGGGSFSAWADVARRLPAPFFAVQSAHEDPEALLVQLRALPWDQWLVMGSCVGSGLAADLAQRLEARRKLAGLVIAASTPPVLARLYGRWFNPWRLRSVAAANRALQRLSARKIKLGRQEVERLREDTAWFLRFLARQWKIPVQAPVLLTWGADDPMLPQRKVQRRWERLLGRTVKAFRIPGAMHDIVHTHSAEIAEAIRQMFL
ncbi:MAG: amino acid adenylation domain-containing protein [Oscillospiraceae bacterium]|jgi:amino acid adenylation domain-containing protein|nr:amino acid adenylation domain-containing protein [Oscillospiraceae bacterium]